MRFLICLGLALAVVSVNAQLKPNADANVNEDEKAFDNQFNELENDEAKKIDGDALKKSEEEINKDNKAFNEGKSSFSEKLSPESNIPKDELEKEKEGAVLPPKMADRVLHAEETRGMGLVMPPEDEQINSPESEAYLKDFYARMARGSVPASFNAKNMGLVTIPKNQKSCGSCAAFAATGLHETCMLGAGGSSTGMDLSEQYLVDCGYNAGSMNGCGGAYPHAYTDWFANKGAGTAPHEATYPYLDRNPNKNCNANPAKWSSGSKVTKSIYDYRCNEDKMKGLVAQHGAVAVAIYASEKSFGNYNSGVYTGCTSTKINHAVLVVGYGTERGVPYWLVKNSWGKTWGDNGYIKMKRGVNECGIAKICVTAACTKSGTAAPAPVAPPPPPIPAAQTCDISGIWGPGITGRYTLRYGSNGKMLVASVDCTNSVCRPQIAGPSNACMYICGKTKCG